MPMTGMSMTATSARVIGVDTARGLALIGMFVAHVAPVVADPAAAALLAVADERPRLLFALTAGVGLGFISGGTSPIDDGTDRGVLRRQIAIRAIALIVLGVTIALTLHPLVYIILDVYGVAFLLMLPLLFLSPRLALGLGIGLLVFTPAIAEIATRTEFVAEVRATPFAIVADWVVGGAYPVIVWVPVMLIGLAFARLDLGSARTVGLIGLLGAAAAALLLPLASMLPSPSLPEAASSLPLRASLEAVANVGVGAAVLAALLWATGLASSGVRRIATAVASPVTAMGSMPLSVYTVHLVVIALAIRTDPETGIPTDDSWGLLVGLIVGSMLFAWLWRRFIGRGPLEWALRTLSGRSRRSPGEPTRGDG